MKRQTVLKMLNKRLADSKHNLKLSYEYDDLVNVLGGCNISEQYRINLKNDIDQLNFLKECLNNREHIEKVLRTNIINSKTIIEDLTNIRNNILNGIENGDKLYLKIPS